MWLHLPSSVYSAGPECSTPLLESQSRALEQFASWKGKSLRPQFWRRVWRTAACAKHLSGVTLPHSTAESGVALWMGSLADSLVPICPLLADRQDSTEPPADCFSSTSESFAKFGPDGYLLKTSRQFSLFQQEQPFSENLPNWGSMQTGELFQRQPWVPRIDATGLGYSHGEDWRTPNTRDHHQGGPRLDHPQRQFTLVDQVAQWKTPDVPNGGRKLTAAQIAANGMTDGKKRQVGLENQASVWATPNCRDDHNPSTPDSARTKRKLEQGWTIDLNEQAAWWTTPQAHDANGGSPERVGRFGTTHGGRNLADDVTAWPTPKSRDCKSAEGPAGMKRDSPDLNVIASHFSHPAPTTMPHGNESSPSGQTSRRRLNPAFVDWLMGLPPGWTDYAPVETEWWYSRLRRCLSSLRGERD